MGPSAVLIAHICIYCFFIAFYFPTLAFRVTTHNLKPPLQIRCMPRYSKDENSLVSPKLEGLGEDRGPKILLADNQAAKAAMEMHGSDSEALLSSPNAAEEPLQSEAGRRFLIDNSTILTMPHEEYVVVGHITTTYGLKGHVKVKAYTPDPEVRLCEPGYRYLKVPYNDDRVIPIKIERGRCSGNKDVYILKFEGFDTIDEARRLTNTYLTIPLAQMPPPEEDTYFARDLIGLDLLLYNDLNRTKLGKILRFVHHSDLATRKKFEDVCDDLIEVQMDIKVSLQTLIDVANAAKENREPVKFDATPGISVVTERELYEADEVADMYDEFDRPNFKSMLYVKYYQCSECSREFTNHTQALMHERMHEQVKRIDPVEAQEPPESEEDSENKIRVLPLEEIIAKDPAKPLRRFYVPLIRNETVKYIDVPNKSVYVDPYTIFIGEDPNRPDTTLTQVSSMK